MKSFRNKGLIVILSLILSLGIHFQSIAQQDPMYTQFMFNKLVYNPGYAGSNKEFICATFLLHDQWQGFSGKGIDPKYVGSPPQTQTFSINGPLKRIFSGVGLYVINDKAGFESTISINATLSVKKEFRFGTIQLGLNGGLIQKSVNGNWLPPDPGPDNFIPGNYSDMIPDLGLGLYAFTDRYYIGVSAQHLIPGNFQWGSAADKLVMHYYLIGGYNWIVPFNPNFEVQPTILVKNDLTKLQFDINTNVLYKNKYWGGLQYREGGDISILLGMKLSPQLKFGYSYDIGTSKLSKYHNGTHEITVNYCFKIVIKTIPEVPNILWNTRHL